MTILRGLATAALILTLAACQGQVLTPQVTEQARPTATQTPTRTPIWFPATETPTPMPTLTLQPTLDFRPGVGEIILRDPFSGGWQTAKSEAGSAAFGRNELTLAVALEQGALSSFRAVPLPANSYLEVVLNPSLCRGADAYGLYLRASSVNDGYRVLVSCSGLLRLERLKNSELVVLQDWSAGIGVVPGGLIPFRLGVWANGTELRIFIDDIYQFSARDPVYPEGLVGAYAHAAGTTPLTVSFSGLVVRSLDPARIPTATPQPTAQP